MRMLVVICLVLALSTGTIGCTKLPQPQQSTPQNRDTLSAAPKKQLAKESQIKIYLIALNDKGRQGQDIGTGDSLVAVNKTISPTPTPLKAAFTILLSLKEPYYGSTALYNALYRSDLKLDKATLTSDGKAEIYLSGSLALGGVMDNPRVEKQLTETARQFSTVKEVQIYINNKTLKDALSLK